MINVISFLIANTSSIDRYFGQWTIVPITLFVLGIGLLIVEMITPGLGIPGVTGFILLVAAIIWQAKTITDALITIAAIIVILFAAGFIIFKSFSNGRLSKTDIVLKDSINSESTSISNEDTKKLIGKQGVALSELRPVGYADIEGRKYDVITDGDFIKKGEHIEVCSVEELKIKVKKI